MTDVDTTAGRDLLDRIDALADPGADVDLSDLPGVSRDGLGDQWRAWVTERVDSYPDAARLLAALDRFDPETGDGRDLPAALAELGDVGTDPEGAIADVRASVEGFVGERIAGPLDRERESRRLDAVLSDHPANTAAGTDDLAGLTVDEKRGLLATADAIAAFSEARNGHGSNGEHQ